MSGYLWELSEDKRSEKEFKLLFGLARPPTAQYNRWVECVIKIVAREFPGFLSSWKDEGGVFLTKEQRPAG